MRRQIKEIGTMSNAPEFGQGQGTLSQAASRVQQARADFTQYSQNLTDRIAAVQGQWGGQGARAFFTLHQTWSEKQDRIVRALDDFADSLGVTERDNMSTDDDQSSAMTNLTNKLG